MTCSFNDSNALVGLEQLIVLPDCAIIAGIILFAESFSQCKVSMHALAGHSCQCHLTAIILCAHASVLAALVL